MTALDYPVHIQRLSEEDGGGFVAYALDLPGCMSDGETQDEALANLQDAIEEWQATARLMGREVPAPQPIKVYA